MGEKAVSGRIEGLDETLAAFSRLGKAGQREGGKAVAATAQKVRFDAIKEIQRGVKSGRVYEHVFATIGGKLVIVGQRGDGNNLSPTHQASAEGEAPANDTGGLVRSIKAVTNGLNGKVLSKLKYSFYLEYGTMDMGARPFLNPALQANKQYFVDQLTKAMSRASEEFNR